MNQVTGFGIVQTSFHNQHSLTLAGSTVSSQYDIEITEAMAEYNIQTQLNCVNVNSNRPDCRASGNLILTPRTDVWVEATGFYDYVLPTVPTTATMNFLVQSFPQPSVHFGDGFADDSVLSGPHSAVFNLHATGLIPAGTSVQVSYIFRTSFLTGSADVAAASFGNLHVSMTPVPEPAAVGPMLLAAFAIVRRRSTRRQDWPAPK